MYQTNDSTTLLPCRVFKAHKDYINRILLSPDIKLLATCSADHTVRIWRIDMNEENLEAISETDSSDTPSQTSMNSSLGQESRSTSSLASRVTNGGGTRANEAENTDSFRVISDLIAKRKPLPCETILENHQRWVWDCAFSADSAYLVTVCSDHYARLWELSSSTIIRQYNGHHRGAVCVALNDYSNQS